MAEAIQIQFPMGGINENEAYAAAGKPQCIRPEHVLNMRPFDSIEGRARGGQRPGFSKFIASAANSSLVQRLLSVVEAQSIQGTVSGAQGAKYSNPSSLPPNAGGAVDVHPDGTWVAWVSRTSNTVSVYAFNSATGFGTRTANFTVDTQTQTCRFSPDGDYLAIGTRSGAASGTSARIRVYPFNKVAGTVGAQINPAAHPVGSTVNDIAWSPTGGAIACAAGSSGVVSVTAYPWTGTAFGTAFSAPTGMFNGGAGQVDFHPSANAIVASDLTGAASVRAWDWTDGAGWGTFRSTHTPAPGGSITGVRWHDSGSYVFVLARVATGNNDVKAVGWSTAGGWGAVAGGFELTPTNDKPTVATGALAVTPSGHFVVVGGVASIFTNNQEIFIHQFTAGSFDVDLASGLVATLTGGVDAVAWDPDSEAFIAASGSSPFIHGWEFDVTTTLGGVSARQISLLSVQGGSVYRSDVPPTAMSLVTNGSGVLTADIPVGAVQAFQNIFFCDTTGDGYVYLDLSDNTIKDWSAAVTGGALPVGSIDNTKAARIMALYRGRVILSGLEEDPHNWFMSKAGDPFDWDYSPATTTSIQAVAGNNSDAGLIGDLITALISYSDDLLIFGGDHTLWMLRGDPAAGGTIDNISHQIGVVGAEAYCWDPVGRLYFFGKNGLYLLIYGQEPQLLSNGRMDRSLQDVDLSVNHVRLVYDPIRHGVHIFVTPAEQPLSAGDHWFWDQRTDSFWRDQVPVNLGPTAVYVYDADDPDDRAVLAGGFDGFIRFVDDETPNDDGNAIDAFVRMPVLHPGLPMGQFAMNDLQIHLGATGDGATFEIYRGKTPEEAADSSTVVFSKALAAGRNLPIRKRVRANAIQYRVRNATLGERFAYEAGTVFIDPVGRQRARL